MAEQDILRRVRSIEKYLGLSYDPNEQDSSDHKEREGLIKELKRIAKISDII